MDNRVISNIKTLGIDMIQEAGSGHPGIVLGAAPILYTLYNKHIMVNPDEHTWFNRDRFVMSAGHGSALLYAVLYMAGYGVSLEDLKKFRCLESITPGHPEYGVTPGVDVTTGPLGQGFGTAVGLALAEKMLHAKFPLINHKVYVLCSDGDLMEGISYETASFAGNLNLDNLIVLYDSNQVCLDGKTDKTFTENTRDRFSAMGWYTDYVENGEDIEAIDSAITRAKISGRPSFIEVRTVIGNGSLNEGINTVHGGKLTDIDLKQLKEKLGILNNSFYVDNEAREYFKKNIKSRCYKEYEDWQSFLETDNEFKSWMENPYIDLLNKSFSYKIGLKEATRVTNHKVMNEICKLVSNFVGGSADLASATNTYLEGFNNLSKVDYTGKNIFFGVREHGMGAILNGLALGGFKVFGSTFLAFSDYVKPAIRMSALMNLPVNYIFTHDSFKIGQDGPTHQPVEQLSTLRATPNLNVFRPCDANELVGCWQVMLNSSKIPNALILSRGDVELFDTTSANKVQNGAYIVKEESSKLDGVIIATGTEVQTAIYIARELYLEKALDLRVVSMPCMELFENQSLEYRTKILPNVKTVVLEAGSSFGLEKYVKQRECLLTIDSFGSSGTTNQLEDYFSYGYNCLKQKIDKLFMM